MMQTVMLATDGSPSAQDATREAISLASELQLPLTIVCVAHDALPAFGFYGYGYSDVAAAIRKMQREHISEVIKTVRAQAEAAAVTSETVALEGMAGEEICRAAQERDVRFIVMGAHGWGRLNRMIHGSVSEYVLHHADVPVLVVAGDPIPHAESETEKVGAAS
jgi:nucleotide-binding universal stress UspA family protein